jgi:glyoxylase I family protein
MDREITMAHKWMVLTAIVGVAVLMTGCNTTMQSDARKTNPGASSGNAARLEHVALNVADPVKMAEWYVDNLGMKVLREGPAPINARFLADSGGNMMLELYHNPPDAVPNYAAMDPLLLHVAFMVDDVDAVRQKLMAAGATPAGEVTTTPAGDKLAMLRDPWGLAIQFLRRADPMLPIR